MLVFLFTKTSHIQSPKAEWLAIEKLPQFQTLQILLLFLQHARLPPAATSPRGWRHRMAQLGRSPWLLKTWHCLGHIPTSSKYPLRQVSSLAQISLFISTLSCPNLNWMAFPPCRCSFPGIVASQTPVLGRERGESMGKPQAQDIPRSRTESTSAVLTENFGQVTRSCHCLYSQQEQCIQHPGQLSASSCFL